MSNLCLCPVRCFPAVTSVIALITHQGVRDDSEVLKASKANFDVCVESNSCSVVFLCLVASQDSDVAALRVWGRRSPVLWEMTIRSLSEIKLAA